MTGLEKRIFQNSEFKPFLWVRSLDEVFGIWTQGSQKLKELYNCINSLHLTIKFTTDYSATEINFLGVNVTKVGNKLETYLYCKQTDTHQSLYVYKWPIVYGQFAKFKRICSAEEKLTEHLEQLKQWLVKRGYREDQVCSEIERMKLVERTVLFKIWDKKVDDSITLVLTYHPALNQLHEILRRAHTHVLKWLRLHSTLPSPPREAFRNP